MLPAGQTIPPRSVVPWSARPGERASHWAILRVAAFIYERRKIMTTWYRDTRAERYGRPVPRKNPSPDTLTAHDNYVLLLGMYCSGSCAYCRVWRFITCIHALHSAFLLLFFPLLLFEQSPPHYLYNAKCCRDACVLSGACIHSICTRDSPILMTNRRLHS